MIKLHIGLDDTDSIKQGCTTYIAALLVEKLSAMGVVFTDYPNLIRLNPNVPWKTRGNGALCLRVKCKEDLITEIVEEVVTSLTKNAEVEFAGTEPGAVFLVNEVPKEVSEFARKTIQGIVQMGEAVRLLKKFKGKAVGFNGGRGIIGGLAAIGETLERDHTFEILTYRTLENRGTPRKVQASSVFLMDRTTQPLTFNNADPEMRRILITPRGPDPILYGIRGETPEIVKKAQEMVHSQEKVERWVIFRTNQGTDAHLRRIKTISEAHPYNPVILRGKVARNPLVIPGGHVIFSIKDETGTVDCAAYEPTGALRKVVKRLMVGDTVEVYGGVRPTSSKHPITINLEKMVILRLTPKIIISNPRCPKCGKRMKSMGTNKGFRCKKCFFRSSKIKKILLEKERSLQRGPHITPPRSQRHLTKPLCRYGLEKKATVRFNEQIKPFRVLK